MLYVLTSGYPSNLETNTELATPEPDKYNTE